MDLTQTVIPKSDQINADDLIAGPITVTITGATAGSAEQPVDIHLAEMPKRAYRPSKSMRRVLIAAWGPNTDPYTGRRMTLYRDPDVKFGGDPVGGIKISHLSDIPKRLQIALTEKRGKRTPHTVDPLPDAPKAATHPTADQVAECTDIDRLRGWWAKADAATKALIEARVTELTPPAEEQGELSA